MEDVNQSQDTHGAIERGIELHGELTLRSASPEEGSVRVPVQVGFSFGGFLTDEEAAEMFPDPPLSTLPPSEALEKLAEVLGLKRGHTETQPTK